MFKTPSVSVITVKYENEFWVKRLVNLLGNHEWMEMIVGVNDRQVNMGYGWAVNQAVKEAIGRYLLIVNPDVSITPEQIKGLVHYLNTHPSVAAVGPWVSERGRSYPVATGNLGVMEGLVALSWINRLWPKNPVSRRYYLYSETNRPQAVTCLHGACFLFRRKVFNKIGGFDPRFFLYFEENDLFARLKKAGYKAVYYPHYRVQHYFEGSKADTKFRHQHFCRSRYYYFKKHYGLFPSLLVELVCRFSVPKFIPRVYNEIKCKLTNTR